MGPLSYLIAFVCISLAGYYWYINNNNQTKAKVQDSSSSTSDNSKSSKGVRQKFLDFDEDCKIRALKPSDLDTIRSMVKGKGGCNYFLDHSLEPYLDSTNSKYLGFGVEYKKTSKIICTQFIMMVDDNETGLVLGAMIDMKFASDARIIYMRLSNDIQSKLTLQFDHLGKHRCVEMTGKNASYLNNSSLDWKIKFNLDGMTDDNIYYVVHKYDDVDGIKINGDFKESQDMDQVVDILKNKCNVNDVMIDFKLYQVKCLQKELIQEIKDKKLVVMVNEKESGLVLIYGNDDYYVFGAQSKDILSGVRLALSQNSGDNLSVFVSKANVEKDDELKKIFGQEESMQNPIIGLDYDMHIDGH